MESIVPSEERDKMKDFADRDDSFFEGRFFASSDEDPRGEIDELRDNNVEGRVIHWLNYTGDDKFTVKYSNKLSNLRKFIEMECLGERIENRGVVILFGTAGVGKSTVLTTHSQKMGPLSWSVRVNLKDHRKYLKEEANLEESDGIMEFLCQSDAGLKSGLAKSLLRYYLTEDKKRVVLLLDGYDEIENDSQEKINRSIRFLENTGTEVWLTSRLSEQERIEDALGTIDFSYFLNPFDVSEQHDFLRRYWKNNASVKEKDRIDRFAGELLEHFHKLGLMKEEGLIGIVLQARMVADIFHPKPKFDPAEIGILNVWDLYERFIGHQYARYFTEKVRTDIGLLGKGSRDGLVDLYTRAYGRVALKLLFPYDNFCDKFLRNEKCHDESLRRELIDIGIVRNVKRDDYRGGLVANFIHRTYAEYFVAKLSISLINNDAYYQPLRKFLLTNLSLDRNRLIRIFLEYEMRRERVVAVKRKWEMIRLFLGRTEIEDGSLFDSIPVDNSNRRDDKTLGDLTNDVKACVSVESDKYNFNGDANLMEQFLRKLSECTDIKELKDVLRFLLGIDRVMEIKIDKFEEFNMPFLLEANLEFSFRQYNAVLHYFTQSKLQNKPDLAFEREIMRFVHDTKCTFIENFRRTLDELNEARNTRDATEKERRFLLLAELSIRKCEYFRDDLIRLNQIAYHAFNVFDRDAVDYINSVKRIQESFKIEMLSFLERVNFNEKKGQIAEILVDANVKYLQTFVIEIFHHPNIIADIKSSVDEMFSRNRSNILWLEGAGVLVSKFLKILTYEMSSVFTSIIENISSFKNKDKEKIYCYRVLYDLLMYLLHTLETEELPQIDKIALFEMITRFAEIFVKNEKFLPFTSNHLKMALSLLQYILNRPDMGVKFYNIARFLSALDSVKIRITHLADGKILFLDPRTEFKFELSSNYKDRMYGIPFYIGSL